MTFHTLKNLDGSNFLPMNDNDNAKRCKINTASTVTRFVACRCSMAMLALWNTCEVDLLVQRPRNETQLQAMNTTPCAATLLQTFTQSPCTLLQLGSSADEVCGWWIRATAMCCVILTRSQPNTSNTAQALLLANASISI